MTDEQYTDDPMDRFRAIVERRVTGYDTVCTHRVVGLNVLVSASRISSIIHVGIPTHFEAMPNEVIDNLVDVALKDYAGIREDLKDYTKGWLSNIDKRLDAEVAQKKLTHYRDRVYLTSDAYPPVAISPFFDIILIHPKMLDESIVSPEELQEVIRSHMEANARCSMGLPDAHVSDDELDILDRVWKILLEEMDAPTPQQAQEDEEE